MSPFFMQFLKFVRQIGDGRVSIEANRVTINPRDQDKAEQWATEFIQQQVGFLAAACCFQQENSWQLAPCSQ